MRAEYKDFISVEHRYAYRKTWHIERASYAGPFIRTPATHVQNAKRRPCVQKRLAKLSKYVRRAWNGYNFGELKRK